MSMKLYNRPSQAELNLHVTLMDHFAEVRADGYIPELEDDEFIALTDIHADRISLLRRATYGNLVGEGYSAEELRDLVQRILFAMADSIERQPREFLEDIYLGKQVYSLLLHIAS